MSAVVAVSSLCLGGCTEIKFCDASGCEKTAGEGKLAHVKGWCKVDPAPNEDACCDVADKELNRCIKSPNAPDEEELLTRSGRPDAGADGGLQIPGDAGNVDPVPPFGGAELCEAPDGPAPGSGKGPSVLKCDGETVEALCVQQCQALCDRWDWYCGEPCSEGFCESEEVRKVCNEKCGDTTGTGGPKACMKTACEAALAQTCEETLCDGDVPAECGAVTCNDTCAFSKDGVCDDGDLYFSQFGDCLHGTDCSDCGPRFDSHCLELGDQCAVTNRCCGAREHRAAWCVGLGTGQDRVTRCMPDCSDNFDRCPEGTACLKLNLGNGGDGRDAYACIPVVCTPNG